MPKETARLAVYSDAVFAVIVTIMVLELSCEQQTERIQKFGCDFSWSESSI
jgi:uncharacterized membrane protein